MKLFNTILLSVIVFCCHAQTASTLTATSTPKAGEEITYVYKPHAGLALPGELSAWVIYRNKRYYNKVLPMTKTGNNYTFTLTAPDSTFALTACIIDADKAMVDNNKEKAFAVLLTDKQGKQFAEASVANATILNGYAPYIYKISPPKGYVTGMYVAAFEKNASLKENYYADYLQAVAHDDKEAAKPMMASYAKKLVAKAKDEQPMVDAYYLYRQADRNDSAAKLKDKILALYPKGSLARNQFYSNLYNDKEHSVEKYLASMQEYISSFGDSSSAVKDNFYRMIVAYAGEKKDWATVDKYDALVTDKANLIGSYNNFAWALSGEHIDNAGTNLDYAATLSQRALSVVKAKLNDNALSEEEKKDWKSTYDTYADTYALILYKLGKIDSAYYYENGIDKSSFYDGGRELLASCIEKLQGAEAARKYIETELLAGSSSSLLQTQLQGIYKQLNLPEDGLNKIKEKSASLAKEKATKEIVALLGSTQAKNFTLKDLDGNVVSLASLRNKVVVLDFWATWCGPCRASFPAMQEAVTKFKDDKEVAFLFLDVFEDGDEKSIRENTAKFIQENKYTFHVLVDHEGKVPPNYKVDAIPTKFIIDKQGKIVFMGHDISDLAGAINDAKKS